MKLPVLNENHVLRIVAGTIIYLVVMMMCRFTFSCLTDAIPHWQYMLCFSSISLFAAFSAMVFGELEDCRNYGSSTFSWSCILAGCAPGIIISILLLL